MRAAQIVIFESKIVVQIVYYANVELAVLILSRLESLEAAW